MVIKAERGNGVKPKNKGLRGTGAVKPDRLVQEFIEKQRPAQAPAAKQKIDLRKKWLRFRPAAVKEHIKGSQIDIGF